MDEPERLARIRLITERYGELQGLRDALVGSALTAATAVSLIDGGWDAGPMDPTVPLVVAVAILAPGLLWLDRYYKTSFGRVVSGPSSRRLNTFMIPVAFALGIVSDKWLSQSP